MARHGRFQGPLAAALALLSIFSPISITPGLAAEGVQTPVPGAPSPTTAIETATQPELQLRAAPDGSSTSSLKIDLGKAESGNRVYWLAGEASALPANLL